nr:hypothetical protein Iba_chr10aCG2110 [Ipomoea batatas]
MTLSRIVPYLHANEPEQRVAHIPPMVAPGPGSRGKKRPWGSKYSLSSIHPMPGSTTTSMSSTCNDFTRFIKVMSMQTPPLGHKV